VPHIKCLLFAPIFLWLFVSFLFKNTKGALVNNRFLLAAAATLLMVASHTASAIALKSKDFTHGGKLPAKLTCDGQNISPQLSWSGVESTAKSIAIICDDPDAPAGVWTHWVIFNIPPTITSLERNVPATATLDSGARQGKNDFGAVGYGGACPPKGGAHHYFFRIYALDIMLDLPAGTTTRADLLAAMENHIVAQGELMGTYKRR
jgi:Raf kinase inhibitor-like YbhB/YbcL family protein